MTEEERQRMMEFILAQQAQFWANVQKHEEWLAKHEALQAKHEEWQNRAEVPIDNGSFRVDRLERILKLMIKAGTWARRQIREQNQLWDERFADLMRAHAISDKKLAALIEVVRQQRNGSTWHALESFRSAPH
jgi:hypothetical protein